MQHCLEPLALHRFYNGACFYCAGHPELLVNAVRDRFDETGHPRNLHLYNVAAVGDGKGRGLGRLAVKGLVTSYTFAW